MCRRVTVVGLCVCLLSQISLLECLFILKILSCTQWAMEVKNIVGFSLRSSTAPLKAICTVSHFPAESAHVHYSQYGSSVELPLVMPPSEVSGMISWRQGFCTLVHSFHVCLVIIRYNWYETCFVKI